MKLEVGKKYVNKLGTIIEIYAKNPSALVFHGANDTSHEVHDTDRGIHYVSYFSSGRATPDFPEASSLVREFEEPVKYTVDVWVKKRPEPSENHGYNLGRRLFGDTNWHLSSGSETCQRHLRLTVEEVAE